MTTWCSWHEINFEHHEETTRATWGHDYMTIWWHDEGHIETKLQHENMRILEHEDKRPPPPSQNCAKKLRIPAFRFLQISVTVQIHFQKNTNFWRHFFLSLYLILICCDHRSQFWSTRKEYSVFCSAYKNFVRREASPPFPFWKIF